MAVNVGGKNYLKSLDCTPEETRYLLDLPKEPKNMKRNGVPYGYLESRNIMFLFEEISARIRYAFRVAGIDLGMGVTYLDPGSSQMEKKESTADVARVLDHVYDGIEYRGFNQKIVDELTGYVGVPVWNGLTDQFHPIRMLADLLTLEEEFDRLKGLNFTCMGDARNNTGNPLMVACAEMGINFTAYTSKEPFPAEELASRAREIAGKNGYMVRLTEDVDQGAKDVDTVYIGV